MAERVRQQIHLLLAEEVTQLKGVLLGPLRMTDTCRVTHNEDVKPAQFTCEAVTAGLTSNGRAQTSLQRVQVILEIARGLYVVYVLYRKTTLSLS